MTRVRGSWLSPKAVALVSIAFLPGCATDDLADALVSTPKPTASMQQQQLQQAQPQPQLVDSRTEGEKLAQAGDSLIMEGRDLIAEGQARVAQGERMAAEGKRLQEEARAGHIGRERRWAAKAN
jgi:hypothetical protein